MGSKKRCLSSVPGNVFDLHVLDGLLYVCLYVSANPFCFSLFDSACQFFLGQLTLDNTPLTSDFLYFFWSPFPL